MEVRFEAQPLWRGVDYRDPSRDLFGGLADFGEGQAVNEIKGLWDLHTPGPRGQLAALSPKAWVVGLGSTFIMAPFAFMKPGRFGDGSYGVLDAALEEPTAMAEYAHGRARFLRQSHRSKELINAQVLTLEASGTFEDLRAEVQSLPGVYAPEDWSGGQALGARIRASGAPGVVHASVRHMGGVCVAGFTPTRFSRCRPPATLQLFWDGKSLRGPGGLYA